MTAWSWAWLGWLAAGVLLEAWAIFREEDGDTASEQMWGLQRWLLQHGRLGMVGRVSIIVAFSGFCVWMVLHFFRGNV